MIWLQNNQKFDRLISYEPITGKYIEQSKKLLKSKAPKLTDGFFEIFSDMFFALYKYDNNLYFSINQKKYVLDASTIVNVEGNSKKRMLTIMKNDNELYRCNYELNTYQKFTEDYTPFIDNEDFDFGLFVSNVSKDIARKKVLMNTKAIE